jgi:predicted ATP-dependent endonuclease of OLD family
VYLSELRVENFRAIRRGTISLDDGTILIGENDCGISSMLDALELVLGFDKREKVYPPWLFHRDQITGESSGPIRIQLRFSERNEGEWKAQEIGPFGPLLKPRNKRLRELIYETFIREPRQDADNVRYKLRSPGCEIELDEPGTIGRFRRMNPVVRVKAGMLTGHGFSGNETGEQRAPIFKVSPEVQKLSERINRAIDSRISRRSLIPGKEIEDGFEAAARLVELGKVRLGKWESGLTRSIKEILGWKPGHDEPVRLEPFQDPESMPERLGILLLIGALLRALPGGGGPGR